MTSIINTSSSTPSASSLATVALVSLTDPQNVTSGDYDVPLYIVLSGTHLAIKGNSTFSVALSLSIEL